MKKFLTSVGCLALVGLSALGLAACGKKKDTSAVSFGVKGYYMGTDVNIAGYKWTKQKVTDADKPSKVDAVKDVEIKESYKIDDGQTIAYVKFEGDFASNNGNIIAITFDTTGHDKAKFGKVSLKGEPTTVTELETKQTTDKNGKADEEDRFVYFSSIGAETKGFIIYADWEGDGKYDAGYKFVVDGSKLTFAPAA